MKTQENTSPSVWGYRHIRNVFSLLFMTKAFTCRIVFIEMTFDRQQWGLWATGSTMKALLINFPLLNEGRMWIIIHLSQSRSPRTITESGKWEIHNTDKREHVAELIIYTRTHSQHHLTVRMWNTGINMKRVLEYIYYDIVTFGYVTSFILTCW